MRQVVADPMDAARPMTFNLLRVPFFLEPDYSRSEEFEETNRVRLLRKWGGKAGWEAQKARHDLKGRGRAVGIQHFNLDRIASSTFASHRLVHWVTRTLGTNTAEMMYAELNTRHFVEGEKLNCHKMLVKAAAAVGVEPQATRAFLASECGASKVKRAQSKLRDLGVSGIPTLILGGKWMMPSGAVGAKALVEAFREIEAAGGADGSYFAKALGIPSHVLKENLRF